MHPLQPECLDQLHNALETGADIGGQRVEFCLRLGVHEDEGPAHQGTYIFFAMCLQDLSPVRNGTFGLTGEP
jgi:hypothetical protein